MRKWKCVKTDNEVYMKVNDIVATDNNGNGFIWRDGSSFAFDVKRYEEIGYKFEELKEVTDFTKSDLRECDIIVMRNKLRYVYFDGVIVHTNVWSEYLNKYNKDLTRNDNEKRLDVMQVYRNGNLIFKREEQSPRDIKIKELQDKMDAIKREMEELK